MTQPASDLLRAETALRAGRFAEADGLAQAVLARMPSHPGAKALRGAALLAQGNPQAALPLLRAAIGVPGAPALWHDHLRQACQRCLLFDEAVAAARGALRCAPDDPAMLAGLGTALAFAGDLTAARVILAEALILRPDDVGARLAHAHALLAAGRWAEGWPGYEWRLKALARPLTALPGPVWDGSRLDGMLALVSEQGFGDALQFARYIPQLAARCDGVAIACQAGLIDLFRALPGVRACVSRVSQLPPCAAHLSFGSLPGMFGATPSQVLGGSASSGGYIAADPALIAAWRPRLGQGRRVGLVWAGNPENRADSRRSIDLAMLQPVLNRHDVQFVALQKGAPPSDRMILADRGIIDLSDELTDFAQTAAVVAQLDLVISVDSAVAHLAGALGRPVWVLLMEPADWRWLQVRADSPWYPSARLFRQPAPGAWPEVIAAVAAALG